jgi:hypothetical protein
MTPKPDDIVGHKTFATGQRDAAGSPILRHEPLTRADALLEGLDRAKKARAAKMPTEQDAIHALWEAFQRLREMGWREACYCPKDGSEFVIIQAGSTGIFEAHYLGEWPDGYIISHDEHDSYVSRPGGALLFKSIR